MQRRSLAALAFLIFLAGCQPSYVNSPRVAAARAGQAKAFSDPLIARAYQAKPVIRFPARIAIAPQNPDEIYVALEVGAALEQAQEQRPLRAFMDAARDAAALHPADEAEIRRLVLQYARGVDRCDAALLRSIPFPFSDPEANKGSSVEIYHGAHGRFDDQAHDRSVQAWLAEHKGALGAVAAAGAGAAVTGLLSLRR